MSKYNDFKFNVDMGNVCMEEQKNITEEIKKDAKLIARLKAADRFSSPKYNADLILKGNADMINLFLRTMHQQELYLEDYLEISKQKRALIKDVLDYLENTYQGDANLAVQKTIQLGFQQFLSYNFGNLQYYNFIVEDFAQYYKLSGNQLKIEKNWTLAFTIASSQERMEFFVPVATLLEADCFNHRNNDGDTPLHYGLDLFLSQPISEEPHSKLSSIKWLLEKQVDVNIVNNHGNTTFDLVLNHIRWVGISPITTKIGLSPYKEIIELYGEKIGFPNVEVSEVNKPLLEEIQLLQSRKEAVVAREALLESRLVLPELSSIVENYLIGFFNKEKSEAKESSTNTQGDKTNKHLKSR